MTSRITVNNIESNSGISSIALDSGVTINRGSGLNVSGIITATTVSATTVNVGGVLTYEDVTNVDSVGVITAREGIRIGAGKSIGSDGADVVYYGDGSNLAGAGVGANDNVNTTGIITAAQFAPTSGQIVSKNIVINGNFQINQRATSANNANGIHTTDRWAHWFGNTSVTTWTQRVQTTTPGPDAPANEGHRQYFEVVKSDAGSVATNGYSNFQYNIEAQDLACSGWDHKSATSYLTLSFWVRQSAASQTFYGQLRTDDGTAQKYTFAFTADSTWRKVTVTIPGNSNITIDNDNGKGATIWIAQWMGTDYTTSGHTLNAWGAYSGSDQCPDMANGYLTSTAWFRIAGVQLEVGPVATPFEHRSYSDELHRCYRYFFMKGFGDGAPIGSGFWWSTSRFMCPCFFPVRMRTEAPVLYQVSGSQYFRIYDDASGSHVFNTMAVNSQKSSLGISLNCEGSLNSSAAAGFLWLNNAAARLGFDCEL